MLSSQEREELLSNSAEGLPYPVLALIFKIQKDLNEITGVIEIESLQRLQREMWVERVQGRKVDEVKKETIRSYLRTMHKCSGGLIQVKTTKEKKIQVFFPLIKKAYDNFDAQNKGYSDKANNKNRETLEQARAIESQAVKTDTVQIDNSSTPIDINKNKIINKKISIALDFEPTTETINQAIELGLSSVISQQIIDEFIEWNAARETQHTPAYWQKHFISWLENRVNYNQKQQQKQQNRELSNAQWKPSNASGTSIIDRVAQYAEEYRQSHQHIEHQTCEQPITAYRHPELVDENECAFWS